MVQFPIVHSSQRAVIAVNVIFLILPTVAVALRLWTRRKRRIPLDAGDILIVIALVRLTTSQNIVTLIDLLPSSFLSFSPASGSSVCTSPRLRLLLLTVTQWSTIVVLASWQRMWKRSMERNLWSSSHRFESPPFFLGNVVGMKMMN